MDDFDAYEELAARHVSLRRVLALLRPYRRRIAAVAGLMTLASAVALAGPFLLRVIIDTALPQRDLSLLVGLAVAMIAAALLSAGLGAWQIVLSARIGQALLHDLRVRLYSHLQTLSLRFFTGTRTGEVQSRIAGLQALVTETANELGRALSAVVMTAVAIVILDWRLALFVLLIVPGTVLISARVALLRERLTYQRQARAADLSAAVQETLSAPGDHSGPHAGTRSASDAALRRHLAGAVATGGARADGG